MNMMRNIPKPRMIQDVPKNKLILSVQNKFLDQVKAVTDVMQVFYWSRQAGNYTFLESWDQCLYGRLQVTGLLGRLGEISNMFDVSMTVADPCIRP